MENQPELRNETPSSPPERGRAWRIVAIVLILHAALLGSVVLIQGCSKSDTSVQSENTTTLPSDQDANRGDAATIAANKPSTPAPGTDALTPEEHIPGAELADQSTSGDTAMTPTPDASRTDITKREPAEVAAVEPKAEVAAPVPTPTKTVAVKHAVRKGDSLLKIAKKYSVNVKTLAAANKLTLKSPLKLGQKLTIPGKTLVVAVKTEAPVSSKAAAVTAVAASAKSDGIRTTHIVKSGESPTTIARRYGVSVQALMSANRITDARKIRPNQKLLIPLSPTTKIAASPEPAAAPASVSSVPELRPTATEELPQAGLEVKGI